MTVPADLQYTAEHEWVAIKDNTATVGVTAYAAEALGDVVYVSAPAAGTSVQAGEPCGEVESVKSVSDIYSPVDGEVTEVNEGVEEDPGIVNADPYGEGWLFKVQLSAEEPSGLLSSDEYSALTAEDKE
jgi:glycine cleavage system H protein